MNLGSLTQFGILLSLVLIVSSADQNTSTTEYTSPTTEQSTAGPTSTTSIAPSPTSPTTDLPTTDASSESTTPGCPDVHSKFQAGTFFGGIFLGIVISVIGLLAYKVWFAKREHHYRTF